MHDEERLVCPSLITDDLKKRSDDFIREEQCIKLNEMKMKFPIISLSLLYEIVTDLLTYRNIC